MITSTVFSIRDGSVFFDSRGRLFSIQQTLARKLAPFPQDSQLTTEDTAQRPLLQSGRHNLSD